MSDPIPEEVRARLADSFTPKGVEQAWRARWRLLDGQRMCDVWPLEPERVRAALESFETGAYV